LSVSLGFVVGLIAIAAAMFFAFRPYLQARPPKSRRPDPSESMDVWGGYGTNGESGDSHHSAGGEGRDH
jgi:hypothetical protein